MQRVFFHKKPTQVKNGRPRPQGRGGKKKKKKRATPKKRVPVSATGVETTKLFEKKKSGGGTA